MHLSVLYFQKKKIEYRVYSFNNKYHLGVWVCWWWIYKTSVETQMHAYVEAD